MQVKRAPVRRWWSEAMTSIRAKVRNAVREVRIASDFIRFEKENWAEYQKNADREFDTSPYAQEIESRMAATICEVREQHDEPILGIEELITESTFEMVKHKRHRDLLSENHRAQLSHAYDRLNKVKSLLDQAYEERREAFEERDEAQSDIDRWYGKSTRVLFGNSGREIPRSSIFGQSHNDLSCYKEQRDDAYSSIRYAEKQIAEFKPEKLAASESIKELQQRRDAAQRLRAQGVSLEIIAKRISDESESSERLNLKLSQLKVERQAFLMRRKAELGVHALEAKIVEVNASKSAHIAAFQTQEVSAARKLAHRTWWLDEHGAAP